MVVARPSVGRNTWPEAAAAGGLTNGGERVSGVGSGGGPGPPGGWPRAGSVQFEAGDCILGALRWSPLPPALGPPGPQSPISWGLGAAPPLLASPHPLTPQMPASARSLLLLGGY